MIPPLPAAAANIAGPPTKAEAPPVKAGEDIVTESGRVHAFKSQDKWIKFKAPDPLGR